MEATKTARTGCAPPGKPKPNYLAMLSVVTDSDVWRAPQPFEDQEQQLALTATLDADSGIEMWISQLGVGILSISLRCSAITEKAAEDGTFLSDLQKLNHALATAQKSIWLRPVGVENSPEHLHQYLRDCLRPLWNASDVQVRCERCGIVFA